MEETKQQQDESIERERVEMIRRNEKDPLILAGALLEDNPEVVKVEDAHYKYNGKCYDLMTDSDLDTMFLNFCIKYGITRSWKNVGSVIRAFLVYPGITEIKKMNDYENLICLNNGILNIYNKKFVPHSPDYYFDSYVNIDYDPDARECPIFINYINEVFNGHKETIENIIRLGGYLLDTSCSAEKMFLFDGSGSNGKSVLINVFEMLFDDKQITPLDLVALSSNAFSKELLIKSRLNVSAEQRKTRINTEELKKIITGDRIEVNRKYKISMSFHPKTKVITACNGLPTFNDTSYAIFRRLMIFKFNNRYVSEAEYSKINDPKRSNIYIKDKKLLSKIEKEMSSVINLFIEGLIRLREDDYEFLDSSDYQKTMNQFKKDSDTIREFLEDNYQVDDESSMYLSEVFEHYRNWYRSNVQDVGAIRLRKNEMGKRIKEVFSLEASGRDYVFNTDTNKTERETKYAIRPIVEEDVSLEDAISESNKEQLKL